MFSGTSVCATCGVNVHDRPGLAEVGGATVVEHAIEPYRLNPFLTLVIGDERDLRRFAVAQNGRREIAAARVGHLLQLAGAEIQRPDVRDIAVLRDLRRERRLGIDRRGREGDQRRIHELHARVVVRAERQCRFWPLARSIWNSLSLLLTRDAYTIDRPSGE
jgi:hypothetical protein